MKAIAPALLLSACLGLATGAAHAHSQAHAQAQADDMFPTKAAAEKRARELKCSGAFAMGNEWMPCQNMDADEKAVSKSK